MPILQAFTPWLQPLSDGGYLAVLYADGVAMLALLASAIRAIAAFREIGPRYRPAAISGLCIAVIAFASYAVIVAAVAAGYVHRGAEWVPVGGAEYTLTTRYLDWTVTVPLLTAELVAVTTLTGVRAVTTRALMMGAAVLMIGTGFVGGVVVDDGADAAALLLWGAVSAIFYLLLYGLLIWSVARSRGLRGDIARTLRAALVLLLTVWLVYPLAYLVQLGGPADGASVVVMQVAFAAADIVAKVGFGVLIHQVAKLRTAEDVQNGVDEHPEGIWTAQVKRTDAVQPPVVSEEVRVPTVFDATSGVPVVSRAGARRPPAP